MALTKMSKDMSESNGTYLSENAGKRHSRDGGSPGFVAAWIPTFVGIRAKAGASNV